MFQRYTEKSIKVIMLSQEESRRLGHSFVGTEQFLLDTIGEGTGIGAKVLKSMGVALNTARIEVEKIIGRGSGFVALEIPFTPRAKSVLNVALEESDRLGHNYIGTEHLLLGLISEPEGVAARVLEILNVDLPKVREQVIRMLGESGEYSTDPIETEPNTWRAVDRILEDDNYFRARDVSRRRSSRARQDPPEESEMKIMLRSILHRTISIEGSVNAMRAEIVELRDRVERIEGKL